MRPQAARETLIRQVLRANAEGPQQLIYVPLVMAVKFALNPTPAAVLYGRLTKQEITDAIEAMNRAHAAYGVQLFSSSSLAPVPKIAGVSLDPGVLERSTIRFLKLTRILLGRIAAQFYHPVVVPAHWIPPYFHIKAFFNDRRDEFNLVRVRRVARVIDEFLRSDLCTKRLKAYREALRLKVEQSTLPFDEHYRHELVRATETITSDFIGDFRTMFVREVLPRLADPKDREVAELFIFLKDSEF